MAPLPLAAPGPPASRTAAPVLPSRTAARAHIAGADAVLAAAAHAVMLGLAVRRPRRRGGRRLAACRAAAATPVTEDLVAEAREAAEIAALQLEAEKLRKAVADLEADQAMGRRRESEAWFKRFDTDCSGGVDVHELQRGMKEFNGKEMDTAVAERLLAALDTNRDGVLQLEEFDVRSFQASLDKIVDEMRTQERAALGLEEERTAKEEVKVKYETAVAEYEKSLDEDAGPLANIAGALAYILPLLDCLVFGLPLLAVFPAIAPAFAFLNDVLAVIHMVPFGQFLIFIAMQALASNESVPRPVRFNLRQAISIDIAQFLPAIAGAAIGFASSSLNFTVPAEVILACSSAVFLPTVGLILYSVLCSLVGVLPRGIPNISDSAERAIGKPRDPATAAPEGEQSGSDPTA